MSSRFLPLKRFTREERLAICLLRGGSSAKVGEAAIRAFAALGEHATERGFVIATLSSPFVNQDEIRLLGGIAAFQRQIPPMDIGLPAHLHALLDACAAGLTRRGGKLDFRNVARCPGPPEHRAKKRQDRSIRLINRTYGAPKQAVVFAVLRDRDTATIADLGRLGVSRSVVSKMTKRGLIERVGYGVYASPASKRRG
ncbi:hypothetical protein E5554_01765 [Sphingobium sp. PAMC28499]|uniref:type IV toxin-antitoxin system AbiEi family antitoxin domain-containing protein n=1 Tax=Sphingobium sp. PAMC28499 TaxID=2565554 RepID=UPI00109E0FC5|nr:type IV toxin-antitoxin system AbiEi family antitoxin domain-containing protein [Sphingobium sp. PAMC28499]QCB36691.1 hypothetical protein E5554_01765 [Sphingobium sp. PAMC28499]